uniref:MATE efflux family protein 2ic n=1 Tax=Rhizophora mucronata TaxID=61149 RepID=A0A2P2M5V9_RHIMU
MSVLLCVQTIIFIKKPEPTESATVSAMPTIAASAKEVDTDGRCLLPWHLSS